LGSPPGSAPAAARARTRTPRATTAGRSPSSRRFAEVRDRRAVRTRLLAVLNESERTASEVRGRADPPGAPPRLGGRPVALRAAQPYACSLLARRSLPSTQGPLLVVMPDGTGYWQKGGKSAAETAADREAAESLDAARLGGGGGGPGGGGVGGSGPTASSSRSGSRRLRATRGTDRIAGRRPPSSRDGLAARRVRAQGAGRAATVNQSLNAWSAEPGGAGWGRAPYKKTGSIDTLLNHSAGPPGRRDPRSRRPWPNRLPRLESRARSSGRSPRRGHSRLTT